MRTWDDWSDFEVNKAVAERLGLVTGGANDNYACVKVKKSEDYRAWYLVDYCNSWNDIGPIIERNNITIACYDGEWSAFSGFRPWADTDIRDNETHCKNIKRAAAIVFLIMNGVNPD